MADIWEWARGPGHKKQPLLEFYIEQLACVATYHIALRAANRGDKLTERRMIALATAASEYEVEE